MNPPNPGDVVAAHTQTSIYTITPDTGAASALRLSVGDGPRHLLVLDKGVLAGIVSRGDLARLRPTDNVERRMSTPVLCIKPETTVAEALQIMEENNVSYLPVVTGGHIVGAVTRRSLRGEEGQTSVSQLQAGEPN